MTNSQLGEPEPRPEKSKQKAVTMQKQKILLIQLMLLMNALLYIKSNFFPFLSFQTSHHFLLTNNNFMNCMIIYSI